MFEQGKVIKTFTSKNGNEVIVRYPKEDDLEGLLKYMNEIVEEDTFINQRDKMTIEEEKTVLNKWFTNMVEGIGFHIIAECNGKIIASCGFNRLRGRSKYIADVGITINQEYRDEGIGTMLMQILIRKGKESGVRILTLKSFENNDRALYVYEKLGFLKLGVIPGALYYKGDYIGEVIMYKRLFE